MPDTANEALSGMLAEGVQPEQIISTLEEAGYGITPPEGDMSYPEPEGEAPGAIIAISGGGDEEPEKEEDEEEEKSGDKRLDAAKSAMKKHGFE